MSLNSPKRLSGLTLVKAVVSRLIDQEEAVALLDRVDLREFFDEMVRHLAAEGKLCPESALQSPHAARLNGFAARVKNELNRDSSAELAALWQDCGEGD